MQSKWTEQNIPSQAGKVALITGANSGIGFETARVLASQGAKVILACRNESKALAAMSRIRSDSPKAALHFLPLDLGSMASIEAMATQFHDQYQQLDLLINNAGVMWLPEGKTEDGFEQQFGINHLGHFALTGQLLPALLRTAGARIVTISSIAHRAGHLDFNDLFFDHRPYSKHRAYGQSKLANLVFARELEKRLNASGAQVLSVAAHPGVSHTNLAIPGFQQSGSPITGAVTNLMSRWFAQSALKGALPTLFAATSEDIQGGEYIGPTGFYEAFGYPGNASSTRRSRNPDIARSLWEASEKLTGITFPFQQALKNADCSVH